MVRLFILLIFSLSFVGCYINRYGYKINVFWGTYHVLWEHPVDLDSDEEQVIDVPFIKYGDYFSLCFDKEWGNPVTLPDSEYFLPDDSLEILFYVGDTVLVGGISLPDYSCPINGRHLLSVDVPEDFDREQGGQLHIRVRKRHYFKNTPNARVVLARGSTGSK